MCGRGYYNGYVNGPVWKISQDNKHVTYYAPYSMCEGETAWCKKHCFLNKKPLPKFAKESMSLSYAEYYISHFTEEKFFENSFKEASFVTFFASGTLDQWREESSSKLAKTSKVIQDICLANPNKTLRFFTRTVIEDLSEPPPNSLIIASVDLSTHWGFGVYAITHPVIKAVAVVDHPDNYPLISELKNRIQEHVYCEKCGDGDYLCFKNSSKKFLLIMDYQ